MATSIAFNDGSAGSLVNGQVAPGDRFANWKPKPNVIGESSNPQSSPVRTMFRFRTDHAVAFDLPKITSGGATSNLTVAYRLKEHLERGGTCTVNTGDAASSSYTMCLGPGGSVAIELSDTEQMEYTMSFTEMVNTGGAMPVCRYNG